MRISISEYPNLISFNMLTLLLQESYSKSHAIHLFNCIVWFTHTLNYNFNHVDSQRISKWLAVPTQ